MKSISIIIPTTFSKGNRIFLKRNLNFLGYDALPFSFEIIIIVDKKIKDKNKNFIRSFFRAENEKSIKVFFHPKLGPAAARNLGIKMAEGKVLLFLNDDISFDNNLLYEHLKWHKRYSQENVAILGKIVWHHKMTKTPLLDFLEEGGVQFDYSHLKHDKKIDFKHFYTGNLSLKKNFLLQNGLFNEIFKYPAYEDIDLGYRLSKEGLKIIYNENAIAYHYHPQTLESLKKRMFMVGQSAKILAKIHPELVNNVFSDHIPAGVHLRYRLVKPFIKIGEIFKIKKILYPYYSYLCQKWFLERYRSKKS